MSKQSPSDGAPAPGLSRRSFLQSSAGVAAGAAAVAVPVAAVAVVERVTATSPRANAAAPAIVVSPSTRMGAEPVTAILRSLGSDEVTVLSGTTQTTVRDSALAERLTAAAQLGNPSLNGGS